MDLSLIICTWNNSRRLSITLNALGLCRIPAGVSCEFIIVNNNSTDDTQAVVLSFKDKLPVKYIVEPLQGISRARNTGLKAAAGKLIVFTDDDVEPCQEWLQLYWEAFQKDPQGFYWGGPIESIFEKGRLDPELMKIAPASVRGFDLGKQELTLAGNEFFLGANWACPSKILMEVGGFDIEKGLNPQLGKVITGEENDLMERLNKLGLKGRYLPQASIAHFVPFSKMSLKHIALRHEAYGLEQVPRYESYLKDPLIAGVPRWMLKEAFSKWGRYMYKRISGAPWIEAYAHYREYLGILKGLREMNRIKGSR